MKTKLVNVGFAPITRQDKDTYTVGTPVYFAAAQAGGREYKADPTGSVKTIDANSQTVYEAEVNGGYEIELTLIDIIDTIAEQWLDYEIRSNGTLEVAKDTEKPRFALILSDNYTCNALIILTCLCCNSCYLNLSAYTILYDSYSSRNYNLLSTCI